MVTLSVLVYYTGWIFWVLEIINSIFNIWTISATIFGCMVVSLDLIYPGVENISQSYIIVFFLIPILLFLQIVEIVLEEDNEEETAPAAWYLTIFFLISKHYQL